MNKQTVKSFTDLKAWQVGHRLVLEIYKMTVKFPKSEDYGLTSQIRRAAVSITSNIAEGFSRESSKEKIKFYRISKGSLYELQNQLLIAKDIGLITVSDFQRLSDITIDSSKLLTGLIRSTLKM